MFNFINFMVRMRCGFDAGAELLKNEMLAAAKFIVRQQESQTDAKLHDNRRTSSLHGK